MRVSPVANNFNVYRYQNMTSKDVSNNIKNTVNSISFTRAIEYDANYNKAMIELVEDSNRYAYHQNNVDERKYILSKYNNSPSLYKHLAFDANVRYQGLERGKYTYGCGGPMQYSAIEHVVHEGDLTGTYLLFEYAPNHAIKDQLANTLLDKYLAFVEHDTVQPEGYESYKHKETKGFRDNPFVVMAALKHMSDENKNENMDKISKVFTAVNKSAKAFKENKKFNKYHDFLKAGYQILNALPANAARNMIEKLDKDIRCEYNKYIDELD